MPMFVQCIGEGAWCGQSGSMFDLNLSMCLFWTIITSWVMIRENVENPKFSTEKSFAESFDFFYIYLADDPGIIFTVIDYKLTVLVGNCTSTMCIQSAGRLI